MTIYQELQLNQAGSKRVISSGRSRSEKAFHIAVYGLKIGLTLCFCIGFVGIFSAVFGSENSIAGVAVLLCVMMFRFTDFGIHATHSMGALAVIFLILAAGPRLANETGALLGLAVNIACILGLLVLGCHNVTLGNHSTLVLSYLLLYGYDVTGEAYRLRIAGLAFGAVLTGAVYYRNHRAKTYKRGFLQLLREFDPRSFRTRWQLSMALGVSSALFFVGLLGLPRAMWAGIAAMSVMVPFQEDTRERVRGRIPGTIFGGVLFLALAAFLPEKMLSGLGILGGIGVGLSATYRWQAVFNSLGAISGAAGTLGLAGAVFYRVLHNLFGALYGRFFKQAFNRSMEWLAE